MGGRTLGEVAVTAVTLTLPATQRSNSVRALGRRLPNLLNLEAAREEESVTTCEHLLLRLPARPHCFSQTHRQAQQSRGCESKQPPHLSTLIYTLPMFHTAYLHAVLHTHNA